MSDLDSVYERPEPFYTLNLDAVEQMMASYISLAPFSEWDHKVGFTDGVLLDANRSAHGAELHLSWEHVRDLRDALTRVLKEAGKE